MDRTRAAPRKAYQRKSDHGVASAQVPHNPAAGRASLPQYFVFYSFAFWFPTMLKRQSDFSDVRVGLLGAVLTWQPSSRCRSMVGTPIGTVKGAGTPRSRCLSLQPDARLISPPAHSTLNRMVHHGVYGLCLSPDVLGNPDRDPESVGRSGRSGHGQRCGQRSRLCRPSSVRLPEHANGIIFVRPGPNDGLRPCWRAADTLHSEERAGACPLNRLLVESQPMITPSDGLSGSYARNRLLTTRPEVGFEEIYRNKSIAKGRGGSDLREARLWTASRLFPG